ncbi:ABC transporter ATP-binding protein [Ornithinimicrobium cryptoxanthini]|uniref:ABC transporter ATP-binding protein/permease n=1 Tax=Ornithinimicrobium cryptoxanthini TaxID=2934161 RepID=A0ABY4YG90_9MICO|nr:ABC transporter ATP-binding protein [Ornithinimicrobium cryptoxanthini]USQ75789.1 ABC transporter ATP-binding protein/permease [Ornithinimicrobium cryptoxanthini]
MSTTQAPLLPPGLAAESARTWDAGDSGGPVIPDELVPPTTATVPERAAAMRRRHLLRERRAAEFVADTMSSTRGLPIAAPRQVMRFIGRLLAERRLGVVAVVLGNALAAVAGLLVPWWLGRLVDSTVADVAAGRTDAALATANTVALVVGAIVVLQALLTLAAKSASAVLGQGILASAREFVVRAILRLPLSRVESASSGDLVTRVTRDVGTMSESVRWALPQVIVAGTTVVATLVAMVVNSWLLALPSLVLLAISLVQVRRYLRRAPNGYLTEGGTYSRINTHLTETVEGARTVEALRIGDQRLGIGDDDIEVSAQAERYGLTLRNLLFLVMDLAFSLPRVLVLTLGAVAYTQEWATIGQITTAVLYTEALWGPFDMLVHTLDNVQVGIASTTRLLGIATVPPDREADEGEPVDSALVGSDLRYAYRPGQDVLHGIDLSLAQGERLAIVGPSGSGKSTLGRLLAGIHGPRTGSVRVGGVDLTSLPLDHLRREVALVTQEHHVFIGTVRDNIVLAREEASDDEVVAALRAVGAWDWVSRMPEGLDARIGSGAQDLTPGQAQQVALARLILADPHTIVLDEATSLIDPRTARHLEGSMNALLSTRTVVAIAHRLHTAHDADRIAVVIDGRVAELGSHDELVALNGEYAALWRAWTT